MSSYTITISHPNDDDWKIDVPEDATVGEAIDALTIHLCHLCQSIGLEPEEVIEEIRRTLADQAIHIHQDLDRSETF